MMSGAFARRRLEGELMDDPALTTAAHETALRGLKRLNAASRTAATLWPHIARITRAGGHTHMSLLDVASGGGDIAIALARRAQRRGTDLDIHGCDISENACHHATMQADKLGVQVRFFPLDALTQPVPAHYNIIVTTLFLHHLENEAIVRLLKNLASHCDHLLVSDLLRGPAGYALAWAGTRALSRSRIVRADGLRSVRAALSYGEAQSLARRAGLADARFERHWPQRFLLHWQRPGQPARETLP